MEHPHQQQQQQQQVDISLPPRVEQMISRICEEQNKPQPKAEARHYLARLTEPQALVVLSSILPQKIKYSFDNFIIYMVNTKFPANANANGESSPNKRLCSTPPPPPSSSPSVSYGNRTHSPAGSIKPVRLTMPASPSPPPPCSQSPCGGPSVRSPIPMSFDGCGSSTTTEALSCSAISPQMVALGELEFRKAFLILSYLGGHRLEDNTSADQIHGWKNKPMNTFETEVWTAFGFKCGYIEERSRSKFVDWDSGRTHIYHCHVLPDATYRFKGPYLTKLSNFLQRSLGDDNVLLVKFAEAGSDARDSTNTSVDHFAKYQNIVREGIMVGLRRYRFFVFKDGGKEEKRKDPTSSSVKCFFVRMESSAFVDRGDYILHGKTVRQARSLFMHVDNLPSLSNYMARFSLILSKTLKLEVDLSTVVVKRINDIPCEDEDGNPVPDKDGKLLIHTDGTGFISEDLAFKCPKNVYKGNCLDAGNLEQPLGHNQFKEKSAEMQISESQRGEPPLLIQFRLFNNGAAVKGTFLLNKKLPPRTIHVRPSMIKVEKDEKLLSSSALNSLEIVGTSNPPRKACLSRQLIALLNYGGVPDKWFMDILENALEDARGVFSSRRAALRAAINYGGMDDYDVSRMILAGIPLEETYLRCRLSVLLNEEKNSLKAGKIPIPDSYHLMGTADPTGLLKRDEVCIILDNGHVSGDVLVYRYPGEHFGDIHILKAKYVEKLQEYVGNAKYAIFFPTKGPRSLGDEIAGGDFDGDLYFVSRNPQLLENFKQGKAWTSASATRSTNSERPSQFGDEELEIELFKLFLRNRFQPSGTVGLAADSWQAIVDRLLTLGDDCSREKDRMIEKLNRLVDIYYDALDAPKKGIKIEVPKELKAELYPHYMERKPEISYNSSSILGLIYNRVVSFQQVDHSNTEVWKLPCFYVEVPSPCYQKWGPLYDQYREGMRNALNLEKEHQDEAANEVIRTYKEILYEAPEFEESRRPRKDVFDEACAIYQISYDFADNHKNPGRCNFAWRVGGRALCAFYMLESQKERPLMCSLSALKDIFT
ncbi:hypothetical protein Tsubulata_021451 [Turnera subulata]|uniref:RNA-dependent RNA polymerase n=1 Tax=Turnera subulata TaxID=218843 RepID=A0A9Q0JFB1_9ROSI|nr:hypothetical protein Tsubulata_021451 [Turnera subulata]